MAAAAKIIARTPTGDRLELYSNFRHPVSYDRFVAWFIWLTTVELGAGHRHRHFGPGLRGDDFHTCKSVTAIGFNGDDILSASCKGKWRLLPTPLEFYGGQFLFLEGQPQRGWPKLEEVGALLAHGTRFQSHSYYWHCWRHKGDAGDSTVPLPMVYRH